MNLVKTPILWVCAFGLLVRLYPYIMGYHFYIGEDPYFHLTKVEALSALPFGQMFSALFSRTGNADTFGGYPPLMHIVTAIVTRVLPISWAFILVPSLLGAGSDFLVYLIANEIFLQTNVGLLAAVISAVSLDNFRYSASNFMPQTMGVFISLCIILILVKVYKRRRIRSLGVVIALLWMAIIVTYTSYFALFGGIILLWSLIIGHLEKDYFMVRYSALSLVASLALSAHYLINVSYHPSSLLDLTWTASLWDVAAFPIRLGLVPFMLFPLGIYQCCKKGLGDRRSLLYLLFIWSSVLLVLSFIQVLPFPNPASRYIVLLTFPVAIISGFGIIQCGSVKYFMGTISVLIVFQVVLTCGWESYSMIEKMSMNEGDYNLLKYIEENRSSANGPIRLIAPPSSFIRYHLKGLGIIVDEAQYMKDVEAKMLPTVVDGDYMLWRHNDKYHYKNSIPMIKRMKQCYDYREDRGAVLFILQSKHAGGDYGC